MKLGGKASEKVAEKFGEDAWNKAKAIWTRLEPEINAHAEVKRAVEQVATKPDSKSRQAVLQEELEILLNEKTDLAQTIALLLQAGDSRPGTSVSQTVTGNHNQIIGQASGGQVFGHVSGPVIIGAAGNPTIPSPAVLESTQREVSAPIKTILVLAANPRGTNALRLGEEIRKIRLGLERSPYRDRFKLEPYLAATTGDLRQALLEWHPQILHFSGHGVGIEVAGEGSSSARKLASVSGAEMELEGLVFEDEMGQPKLVSSGAIANLFALFADQIECVVLNACYSVTQASAIAQHIPYVIGMKRAIGDRAAIEFAIGFYDALLAGRDVEFAYKLGCNAIELEGMPEQLTPVLLRKPT